MEEAHVILRHLTQNVDYLRKVIPHIKREFFRSNAESAIFKIIDDYYTQYGSVVSTEILKVGIERSALSQMDYTHASELLVQMGTQYKSPDLAWLLEVTEEFCIQQSVVNAITTAVEIIDGRGEQTRASLPELMKTALDIRFDTEVGHDYIGNVVDRYLKLREQTERLPFDIFNLNKIYGGGLPRKTLSLFVGGTGSGKSLVKSHCAAQFYLRGLNVLYVTLELAEERIGERFDANLFDMNIGEIYNLPLDDYKRRLTEVANVAGKGRIFIKEFPPASTTASHIRALLDELRTKKDFTPDVLVVDYINLMSSTRYKSGSNVNSYTILKAVAEELRAIAVERDIAVISSTQTTRDGNGASDLSLTNISESMGLGHTADVIIGIIRNEELDAEGKIILKCLKTRFSDKTNFRFMVNVVFGKMKLFNIDDANMPYVHQTGYSPPPTVQPTTRRDVSKLSG